LIIVKFEKKYPAPDNMA